MIASKENCFAHESILDRSVDLSTISILLNARITGFFWFLSFLTTSCSEPGSGFEASIIKSAISTSPKTAKAVSTNLILNLFEVLKMPGVSRKMIWDAGRWTIPSMRLRVVCGFFEVIEILPPSSRFKRVDFPTLGAPTIPINPDLKSIGFIFFFFFHSPACDQICYTFPNSILSQSRLGRKKRQFIFVNQERFSNRFSILHPIRF